MLNRYSSRREKLDASFLNDRLQGARQYDRIAGYFSSSILEVSGEAVEKMSGCVRVICNSELDMEDVRTAQLAQAAMRREWCSFRPELLSAPSRFQKLYQLLQSGKMQVKVIPNAKFGLIHGKAGVITREDGTKTAFIGSANETYKGWKLNYEILWEDDSAEGVNWVQEEFDALWHDPAAVPLSDFIVQDIKRISTREVINSVEEWGADPREASTVIEAPVYRQELGLWEHQKYFVYLAFNAHRSKNGARYVLADQVGLGKTIQLALSAQLMALYGDKPVLILVPKTLIWQWQDELATLLDLPCAVWTGKEWVDENGIRHPAAGEEYIKKCPRRIGIVSQGLIVARSRVVEHLLNLEYECVIVDEAHKARRKKLTPGEELRKPDPNNLMEFLLKLSPQTKSMLFATATPVQLNPIEAWDLLNILSQGVNSVLGNQFSCWRKDPARALNLAMGREVMDTFDLETWDWLRNPFPSAAENERTFGLIRRRLNMAADDFVIKPEAINTLTPQERTRMERIIEDNYFTEYNPFIRHIVRRTRAYLENTIDPETNEPYLKKVEVKLFGEKDVEIVTLPLYLQRAYAHAEEFSRLLKERVPGGGFIRTLLLKRVGSTIIAGKNTAEKMLHAWNRLAEEVELEEEEHEEVLPKDKMESEIKNLTPKEREELQNFINLLEASPEKDPKYREVHRLLVHERWMERGCIIFSQYYDSALWVAENLSRDLPREQIGIYAGGDKSGLFHNGTFTRKTKEEVKRMVRDHQLKILVGTDAASEGLNLQTLGSLINLDLPWNPTRLEQRKGRIQRIGQVYDEVWIYNMRYRGSVEDRVHQLLSERLEDIKDMFGQIPDILEDVWVSVALNEIEEARARIDEIPQKHPFDIRYQQHIEKIDWETCAQVLNGEEKKKHLSKGWNDK
ncbi:MAG: phospholipase D-like domain-containing anti-phage protein [Bacillota bacterium]